MTTGPAARHPFQGGIPFPWRRAEAMALYQALQVAVTQPGQIDLMLKSHLADPPALSPLLSAAESWRQALEALSLADGLLSLCRQLAEDQNRKLVARAACAVLDARPQVERRMGRMGQDKRLVVDRTSLRNHLAELGADDSAVKVLLVRGGPSTGKTWSKYLFERAAEDCGALPVYFDSGIVGSVHEVVDTLYSRLDALDKIPPSDSTGRDWYRIVCNRMPALAERGGRPLWIAVDDLGPGPDGVTPLMDDEILGFFQQFVRHFMDPATRRWFRLLLIHYPDGDVPTKWEQDVWKEDRTRPESVTADDVAEVLCEWAADHDRELLEEQARAVAADVIARADAVLAPPDPRAAQPRLRRIHDEIGIELATLERTTSPATSLPGSGDPT